MCISGKDCLHSGCYWTSLDRRDLPFWTVNYRRLKIIFQHIFLCPLSWELATLGTVQTQTRETTDGLTCTLGSSEGCLFCFLTLWSSGHTGRAKQSSALHSANINNTPKCSASPPLSPLQTLPSSTRAWRQQHDDPGGISFRPAAASHQVSSPAQVQKHRKMCQVIFSEWARSHWLDSSSHCLIPPGSAISATVLAVSWQWNRDTWFRSPASKKQCLSSSAVG